MSGVAGEAFVPGYTIAEIIFPWEDVSGEDASSEVVRSWPKLAESCRAVVSILAAYSFFVGRVGVYNRFDEATDLLERRAEAALAAVPE